MIINKNKQIQNVYYMLAYAVQVYLQTPPKELGSEKFENIEDLFATVLSWGVARQLKQGLCREYITVQESLPGLRGRLDMNGTISHALRRQRLLACEHDEFSENNLSNRILKTTMYFLARHKRVSISRKKELVRLLPFLSTVETVDLRSIKWNTIKVQRNYRNYRLLLYICYLVSRGLLFSDDGTVNLQTFFDERMLHHLYERFILEYYRYHFKGQFEAVAEQIKWDIGDSDGRYLPIMQSDIMLKQKDKTIIIDAKYYSYIMQKREQFGTKTYNSGNLYQVNTYMTHYAAANPNKRVEGMLLYAQTDEEVPISTYTFLGRKFSVRTLDLNCDFEKICEQLNSIANEWLKSDLNTVN